MDTLCLNPATSATAPAGLAGTGQTQNRRARARRPNRLTGAGRLALRSLGLAGIIAGAGLDYLRHRVQGRGCFAGGARAAWLHRWSRRTLRLLRTEAAVRGTPPSAGLLVCNHLSYLDILVLAAQQPLVFVAKAEVRRWPVFGALAGAAGTLFIRRESPGDVPRLNGAMTPLVAAGQVVVFFPEGTSSDGHAVLPFHSALLAPAAENQWPVTAGWIGYALDDGSVEDEVCYWRDMTFLSHLLNLMTKRRIRACVIYGETHLAESNRKALARQLQAEVRELRAEGLPLLS